MCKEELLYNLRNKRSYQLQIIQDLEKSIQNFSSNEFEIKELLLKVKEKEIQSLKQINSEINNLSNH